jgi:hypothetical protein
MSQGFYANTDDNTYRDDRSLADADSYSYATYGVPVNRNNMLVYPVGTGIVVSDRTTGFGASAEQECGFSNPLTVGKLIHL